MRTKKQNFKKPSPKAIPLLAIFSLFLRPHLAPASEAIFTEAERYTVSIQSHLHTSFNGDRSGSGLGSGFILNKKKGLIVTNRHVAREGVGFHEVSFKDGTSIPAEVTYLDPRYDIAILRVDPLKIPNTAKEARIGSTQNLRIGSKVGTFGSPAGYHFSASAGVITSLSRTREMNESGIYLQTDSAIAAGSSGGPLFDLHTGQVIGINSKGFGARSTTTAIGFALSIDLFHEIFFQIQNQNTAPSIGWIGCQYQEITRQRAHETFGLPSTAKLPRNQDHVLLVTNILSDSPASASGAKPLDLIIKIGDLNYPKNEAEFNRELNRHIGQEVNLVVIRNENGSFQTLHLKSSVQNMSEDKITEYLQFSGITVHKVTNKLRSEYGLSSQGFFISQVDESSPFPSDSSALTILSANLKIVQTLQDLFQILSESNDGYVELLIHDAESYFPNKTIRIPVLNPKLNTIKASKVENESKGENKRSKNKPQSVR